jgi:hypothetical protein
MLIVSITVHDPKRRFFTVNGYAAKGSFAIDVGCLGQSEIRILNNIEYRLQRAATVHINPLAFRWPCRVGQLRDLGFDKFLQVFQRAVVSHDQCAALE